jgi:hypothetical protein
MKFSERLQGDMRWDQIQAALAHEHDRDRDEDEAPEPREAGPPRGMSMRRSQ